MAYNKTNWQNSPSTDTPINAGNLNKIEEGIYQNSVKADQVGDLSTLTTTAKNNLVNAINETNVNISNISGTILWTNQNPSSSFASQTITLSSGDYDIYEIYFEHTQDDGHLIQTKSIKGYGCIAISVLSNNSPYRRTVDYTDATHLLIGNSTGTNNQSLIPRYVIGYKTGLFN
jgi:hypothetical protein